MSAKPKLVMLTDGFPYGKGEKSFIIPELDALCEHFDITLVAVVRDKALLEDTTSITKLPSDVQLFTCCVPTTLGLVRYTPSLFFSKLGHRELRDLHQDGFSLKRLVYSAGYYAAARYVWLWLRRHGLFNSPEPTVYYSFWFSIQALALAMERQVNSQVRFCSRIHGYDLYNERNPHGRQPFQRIVRDACSKIFFVSNYSRDYFVKTFGDSERGHYIVNELGVSKQDVCPNLQQSAGEDVPHLLVSCSNTIALKRVDLIAQALALIPEMDIKWIHFGDGSKQDTLRVLCQNLGVQVELPGRIANSKVLDYYRTHQIGCFVTTSSSEGSPVSMQEALSFGIPVVATGVGGIPEMIDGNGFLLSNEPTAEEVADALRHMYSLTRGGWYAKAQRSFDLWQTRYDSARNKAQLAMELKSVLSEEQDSFQSQHALE